MGAHFEFKCGHCGYSVEVSGGRAVGMFAVVRTSICFDCHELVDVLIGHSGQDGPTGIPELDRDLGRCPRCNGTNVTPWGKSHPCPRCGARMRKGGMTVLWD